jgi:hypothetical protein
MRAYAELLPFVQAATAAHAIAVLQHDTRLGLDSFIQNRFQRYWFYFVAVGGNKPFRRKSVAAAA